MQRLTIFGATGRTGRELLHQALDLGHSVTVLARDPGKLTAQSERLRVVRGSLDEAGCVEQAVSAAEAVLSVLGPTTNRPVAEISQGMQAIILAMKKHGVKRLIVSAGAGVGYPGDTPKMIDHLIKVLLKTTSRYIYADMLRTVSLVRASGLDWTVVRVPRLVDGPSTGQIRVGMVGKNVGIRLTRADLASFMLAQIDRGQYIGQAPVISS